MKNLLVFTALLATGFLLGSRRARKAGPVTQLLVEVKANASQAVAALKDLQAQATKAADAVSNITIRGADLVAPSLRVDFSEKLTS